MKPEMMKIIVTACLLAILWK